MRRTPALAAILAAAALIAPAAQAQPADIHAPLARATANSHAQPRQDLRTPDARDAAVTVHRNVRVVNAPGATAVDSTSELPPAGQPTWPVDPNPITAPAPQTVSDGDGSPVPVIPLVAGALLVLVAAFSVRPLARYMEHRARTAA